MKRSLLLFILPLLVFPAPALADAPQRGLPLSSDAFWTMVVGALVPIPSYLLNRLWPNASEHAKGLVHVATAALGAAVYKAIVGHLDFAQTSTWEVVGLAVATALTAHAGFYSKTGLNDRLRGRRIVH